MTRRGRSVQAVQVADLERLLALEAQASLTETMTSEDVAGKAAMMARRACDRAVASWEAHLSSARWSLDFAHLLGADVTAAEASWTRQTTLSAEATDRREKAEHAHGMARARCRAAERIAATRRRAHVRQVDEKRLAELPARDRGTSR